MTNRDFRSVLPGITWPAFPSPPAARMLGLLWQLERTQWWPAARLAARQLDQLGVLLRHAAATVPLYRERFARAGLDPLRELSWEAFRRLPLIERSELRSQHDELQSARVPPVHGEVATVETAGMPDTPVPVHITAAQAFLRHMLSVREALWHDRDPYARRAVIVSSAAWSAQQQDDAALREIFWTGTVAGLDVDQPVERQVRWLRQRAPAYLHTTAANLAALAAYCIDHDIALRHLRGASMAGGQLTSGAKELARRAWHVPVSDRYECAEFGPLALECPQGGKLHVQAEFLVVEVLDERGKPCPPGMRGRVVVTGLAGFAMPLIRYAIGDHAEPGPPCPCGRGLPVITRITRGADESSPVSPLAQAH